MNTPTFLHVSGVLAENGVYRARPGHESVSRGRELDGHAMYRLVLLDPKGNVLLSVAPRVAPRGCGHAHGPRSQGVRGVLPLHPDAVAYELRNGETCLHRAPIASPPPPVTSCECCASDGTLELTWRPAYPAQAAQRGAPSARRADDPGERAVTYAVEVEIASGRRVTVARGLKAPTHSLDLSTFPFAGKGIVRVVANDGVRSSAMLAGTVDVAARPPTLHIVVQGAGGACLPYGQVLSLLGCVLDMSGQPGAAESTAWYLDGERFASGALLAACDGLRPGPHRITFAHEPAVGERVETSLTVQVDDPDIDHAQWLALMDAMPKTFPNATSA